MKVGRTESDDHEQHPYYMDAAIHKVAIVFEQVNEQWRQQQKQNIAYLKEIILKLKRSY